MELVFEPWSVSADLPAGVSLPEGVGRGLARRLQTALATAGHSVPGTLVIGGQLHLDGTWQATLHCGGEPHAEAAPLGLSHHLLYRCAAHVATLLGFEISPTVVHAFDDDAAQSPGAWLTYMAGLGADDPAARQALLRRAFELDPSLVAARTGLARMLVSSHPETAASLITGVEVHDATAASALGLDFFAAAAWAPAAEMLQVAVRNDPSNGVAAAALAALLVRQGVEGAALDEALLLATHATQTAADDYRAWAALADVHRAKHDFSQAGFFYGFALRLQPDAQTVLKDAAATWLQAGEPRQALPLIEQALRLAPGDAEHHGNLAFARHRLGEAAPALDAAREATRLQPLDARLWILQGDLALAAGHKDAALTAFARATELDPGFTINPEGGNLA